MEDGCNRGRVRRSRRQAGGTDQLDGAGKSCTRAGSQLAVRCPRIDSVPEIVRGRMRSSSIGKPLESDRLIDALPDFFGCRLCV